MTTIEDPVFGTLEFENGWTRAVKIPFLNREYNLVIGNAEQYLPDDEQRKTWLQFLERQDLFKTSVEKALFEYYNRHLEDNKARYEFEPADELAKLPTLEQSNQIWDLLEPTRWNDICIDAGPDDETSLISIAFVPSWDNEHGLEIGFYKTYIGIESSGTNWLNQDHYDLAGNPAVFNE